MTVESKAIENYRSFYNKKVDEIQISD